MSTSSYSAYFTNPSLAVVSKTVTVTIEAAVHVTQAQREWNGKGWRGYCPCHEDDGEQHNPSLSINVGTTQPVVVFCWAGCKNEDVWPALCQKIGDSDSRPLR